MIVVNVPATNVLPPPVKRDDPKYRCGCCCGAHVETAMRIFTIAMIIVAGFTAFSDMPSTTNKDQTLKTKTTNSNLGYIVVLALLLIGLHRRRPGFFWPFFVVQTLMIVFVFIVLVAFLLLPSTTVSAWINKNNTADVGSSSNLTTTTTETTNSSNGSLQQLQMLDDHLSQRNGGNGGEKESQSEAAAVKKTTNVMIFIIIFLVWLLYTLHFWVAIRAYGFVRDCVQRGEEVVVPREGTTVVVYYPSNKRHGGFQRDLAALEQGGQNAVVNVNGGGESVNPSCPPPAYNAIDGGWNNNKNNKNEEQEKTEKKDEKKPDEKGNERVFY